MAQEAIVIVRHASPVKDGDDFFGRVGAWLHRTSFGQGSRTIRQHLSFCKWLDVFLWIASSNRRRTLNIRRRQDF